MAKQKLTPDKRDRLRKELAAKVKAGLGRSEILNSLAAKFGITTEGMRWYYKDATGAKKTKKSAGAAEKRRPKSVRSALKIEKKAGRRSPAEKVVAPKSSQNGHSLHLPDILKHTEGEFKRFLAAKKLVPHLEAATRRERELRKSVRTLSRELRAQSSKARQLQRQIKTLTRA